MRFGAPAEAYDRFMGRYTPSLAVALADAAGIAPGMRVVDVGCGPGGLAIELASRVTAENVAAIDPAPQFAAACQARIPGADVREGAAEKLPWDDNTFDAALSSLVIGFMDDAGAGVREMARVTRPGGVVAACMWDLAEGGMTMLVTYWEAAQRIIPTAPGERGLAGTGRGQIAGLLRDAGLHDVIDGTIRAHADYAGFDDFWEPFTFAVGPAGQYLSTLAPDQQAAVREAVRDQVPDGPIGLDADAWFACGTVPG
jgi:SAM-dependent methyltransferase